MKRGSLHLGREGLLGEPVIIFLLWQIQHKSLHLGEIAFHQLPGISKVVVIYIIQCSPISSVYRAGHAAFLITATEMMLFSAMLSPYVPKDRHLMCAICTRVSPSMDSILLWIKQILVRAVKWIWAISFTTVALLLFPTSSITYI